MPLGVAIHFTLDFVGDVDRDGATILFDGQPLRPLPIDSSPGPVATDHKGQKTIYYAPVVISDLPFCVKQGNTITTSSDDGGASSSAAPPPVVVVREANGWKNCDVRFCVDTELKSYGVRGTKIFKDSWNIGSNLSFPKEYERTRLVCNTNVLRTPLCKLTYKIELLADNSKKQMRRRSTTPSASPSPQRRTSATAGAAAALKDEMEAVQNDAEVQRATSLQASPSSGSLSGKRQQQQQQPEAHHVIDDDDDDGNNNQEQQNGDTDNADPVGGTGGGGGVLTSSQSMMIISPSRPILQHPLSSSGSSLSPSRRSSAANMQQQQQSPQQQQRLLQQSKSSPVFSRESNKSPSSSLAATGRNNNNSVNSNTTTPPPSPSKRTATNTTSAASTPSKKNGRAAAATDDECCDANNNIEQPTNITPSRYAWITQMDFAFAEAAKAALLSEGIDHAAMLLVSDQNLMDMGLKMGDRLKVLAYQAGEVQRSREGEGAEE